jgi:hypothetical protein
MAKRNSSKVVYKGNTAYFTDSKEADIQRDMITVIDGVEALGTVTITAPEQSDVIQYDIATGTWVNNSISATLDIQNFFFIGEKDDLPTPSGGIITLAASTTYYFTGTVDLTGDRLVASANSVILGPSSENARIKSTGLGVGVPLLTSEWTIPVRHVTFQDVDTAIYIDGTINAPVALDWTGVNFFNVPNIGEIATCDNFIYSKGAFLNSQNLIFSGTVGTIGADNSIFVGTGGAGAAFKVTSAATITRRFRVIYSSFVSFGSSNSVDVDVSATIPVEGFILDTCNFSAGGTYLPGLDHTSNNTRFILNKGITNTSVNGQMYWRANATATTVSATDTFYKAAGTSIASPDNAKFTMTDNRLTCDSLVSRKFLLQASVSFTAGANNECEFGFYDSTFNAGAGGVRTPSVTSSTAGAGGKSENSSFFCVTEMVSGDYIELHCSNTSAIANITVSNMNIVITEIS